MARRIFRANINKPKEMQQLIKDLKNYRDSILPARTKEFVAKLLEIGASEAKAKILQSPIGSQVHIKTKFENEDMGCKGILIGIGATKEVEGREPFNILLAIEFGAGAYYNSEPNPNANELGYGVGTYPGQIHAFEDGWAYWDAEKEKWRYTHGIKATMPMHNADMKIIDNIVSSAKEVFAR